MPKLYSSAHIIKILNKHGFRFVSQNGSHAKFRKNGEPVLITIVPADKKEIPFGTFRSIVRQSGLNEGDFK